jgi:hypothetical protein
VKVSVAFIVGVFVTVGTNVLVVVKEGVFVMVGVLVGEEAVVAV